MNIHFCSFASDSFLRQQKLQKKSFLKIGLKDKFIHLCSPKNLDRLFYKRLSYAKEENKFGFYAFKPYFIKHVLKSIPKNDILIYMDVNDKPKQGLIEYIEHFFKKFPDKNMLVTKTNYPNSWHMSWSHKKNNSLIFNLISNFVCQPEAGFLAIRNNMKSQSLLVAWFELTATHADDLITKSDEKSRFDQETLFSIAMLNKSIQAESWYSYKFLNRGARQFIDWEFFRN